MNEVDCGSQPQVSPLGPANAPSAAVVVAWNGRALGIFQTSRTKKERQISAAAECASLQAVDRVHPTAKRNIKVSKTVV